MPYKCKALQRILYIVVQSLVYFYQFLLHLVYSGNYEVFSNYIQFYVMIFYTYTYVYIHSISTLYWNLCSGLFQVLLNVIICKHINVDDLQSLKFLKGQFVNPFLMECLRNFVNQFGFDHRLVVDYIQICFNDLLVYVLLLVQNFLVTIVYIRRRAIDQDFCDI